MISALHISIMHTLPTHRPFPALRHSIKGVHVEIQCVTHTGVRIDWRLSWLTSVRTGSLRPLLHTSRRFLHCSAGCNVACKISLIVTAFRDNSPTSCSIARLHVSSLQDKEWCVVRNGRQCASLSPNKTLEHVSCCFCKPLHFARSATILGCNSCASHKAKVRERQASCS